MATWLRVWPPLRTIRRAEAATASGDVAASITESTRFPDPSLNPDIALQPAAEAGPAPPPPPVANVPEFTRAHNAWNAATIKASLPSYMQDNPWNWAQNRRYHRGSRGQAVDGTVGREPQIED